MVRDGTKNRIIKQLESIPFEEARTKILRTEFGYDLNSPGHDFCLSWLEEKESFLRDEREEKNLSLSKEANSIARKALRMATWATIIAIIAIIVAKEEQIFETISSIITHLKN